MIGALTSVLLIWVVTGILFYLAVERIIHKSFQLDSTVMLITSGVGVAVNLVLVIYYIQLKLSIVRTDRLNQSQSRCNYILNNIDTTFILQNGLIAA